MASAKTRKNGKSVLRCRERCCALMKKRKKTKIKFPKILTLKDCKKMFDKGGEYRYAVVSVRYNMPVCLCPTYESAKESVEDYWKYNAQACKIVDLLCLE